MKSLFVMFFRLCCWTFGAVSVLVRSDKVEKLYGAWQNRDRIIDSHQVELGMI